MKSIHSLTILLALGILAVAADGDAPPTPTPTTPAPATPATPPPAPAPTVTVTVTAPVPTTPPAASPAPLPAAPVMVRQPYRPALKPVPKKIKIVAKPVRKPVVKKAAKPIPKPPPPWTTFSLNPNTRVKLDFRNANVDAVIHFLSQASGIAIIKDPALAGGVTLQSPKPQSLNDAFALFDALLHLKNYEITKEGNFLLVAARAPGGAGVPGAPPPGGPVIAGRPGGMPMMGMPGGPPGGMPPGGMPGGGPPGGGPPMMGHVGGPGGLGHPGGAPGGPPSTEPVLKVYAIHYASATEVARVVTEVFATGSPPSQNPFFQPQGPPPPPGNKPVIKASAEDYSNSVIVYAPSAQQTDIAQFITQIDKASDEPQVPRVFKLQYALASDLASIIQGILNDSVPLGRGGATTAKKDQNRNQNFFFFGGSDSSQNKNGTVIADARTNSLVVTATTENLDHIAVVLKQLDQPAIFQSTTWVYAFKNARADVVANLLNQSFGNKTTNGPVGGSLTNTGLNQSSGSQVGQTSGNGSSSQPPSLQNNNNNGNGGNFNNGNGNPRQDGGQFGSNGQTAPTTGLDGEGHVVNIRSLTGQVLLVPNIDTNSVIVVSPPEDRAVVQAILEQMDEIPKQVMIETLVVEANLDKAHQLGIEFNGTQNNPFGGFHGTQVESQNFGLRASTAQPEGLRYTLGAGQYQIFLHAVQTDSRFNVLSTPRIFTTNNATAQINISQSLPYVTNQTVTTTGTILYNYNFLSVGIVLTVTPRITSNGYVTMDVTQTANDFVSYTSFNAPIVNQREAQTTVSVKDGETVVLGGIINNSVSRTVNKIPFLGDLPLVGNLFRSTSKTDNKTELLVFLTPHVVRDPTEARRLRVQTEQELGKTTQQMIPPAQKPLGGETNSMGGGGMK